MLRSPPDERFRAELCTALARPAVRAAIDAVARRPPDAEADIRPLLRLLGREGFLTPHWPREYGGQGLGISAAAIVAEELVRADIPETLHVNSIQIVGQTILLEGTTAQKRRWLPPLARSEIGASILYSEPGVGSDLASLATTAIRVDGGWELSGRKIYSLKTHLADLALCAARTTPADGGVRYQGITIFLLPLGAPGVERRTLPSMAEEQFHEVVLTGVRVGDNAVLGEVGEGWGLINRGLAIERVGLDYALKAERALADVVEHACSRADEGGFVEAVGRHTAACHAARLFAEHMLERLETARVDEALAAAAKWYTSDVAQQVAWWASEQAGIAGALRRGTAGAVADGRIEARYREAAGHTISTGTSEIMSQIVASAADTSWDRD